MHGSWRHCAFQPTRPVTSPDPHLAHARFRARESGVGVGAAVIRSGYESGAHRWECIVADDQQHHYLTVLGTGLGPRPNLSPEEVQEGVERFAATLPEVGRIHYLLNANPLHIDPTGVVRD